MRTTHTVTELRRSIDDWKASGATVAMVPTMGSLHEGHLALARRAGEMADRVVVSIFVNPTQFNDSGDFESYPRDLERDCRLLEEAGCDLVFTPDEDVIYPPGFSTFVDIEGVSQGLEGEFRPGHFRGVATVVYRLFSMVRPDLAVFGDKDAQQLAVVRRMVEDLELGVEIVAHPTVREADGLAMSSRNRRLSQEERRAAVVFSHALRRGANLIAAGETDASEIRDLMRDTVEEEPLASCEYAEVVDPATFQPVECLHATALLVIAGTIGEIRLIDNLAVQPRPATGRTIQLTDPVSEEVSA